MASSFLEVSVLGQPARPGKLYDATTHKVVPGSSPWNRKELEENTSSQKMTSFKVSACMSDSAVDKMNSLDIKGDVKFDLIAGLKANGSYSYLNDIVDQRNRKRAGIILKSTSHYEELDLGVLLKKVSNPEVVSEKDCQATHVIVGVTYGSDAVLEVEIGSATDNDTGTSELEGSLEAGIGITAEGTEGNEVSDKTANKALPLLLKQANLAISGKRNQKNNSDIHSSNFYLEYYGDVPLVLDNISEEDTANLINTIKRLCEESKEYHVPKVLTLMPLSKLREKMSSENTSKDEVHFIPNALLKEIDGLMKDLMSDRMTLLSTVYSSRQLNYLEFADKYKEKLQGQIKAIIEDFQDGLSEQLPLVRRFGEMTVVSELIQKANVRKKNLDLKEKMTTLNSCVETAKHYHAKLSKICFKKTGSNENTREVSLELCFEYLLPNLQTVHDDYNTSFEKDWNSECKSIEDRFSRFKRIALVEDEKECNISFKILTKDCCPKPAQIIFHKEGRMFEEEEAKVNEELRQVIGLGDIEPVVFLKKLILLIDLSVTDVCRVCCRDRDSDVVVFCKNWDVDKSLREWVTKEKNYDIIFAARNKEKFWIPLHDEKVEFPIGWAIKPYIRLYSYENFGFLEKLRYLIGKQYEIYNFFELL